MIGRETCGRQGVALTRPGDVEEWPRLGRADHSFQGLGSRHST